MCSWADSLAHSASVMGYCVDGGDPGRQTTRTAFVQIADVVDTRVEPSASGHFLSSGR